MLTEYYFCRKLCNFEPAVFGQSSDGAVTVVVTKEVAGVRIRTQCILPQRFLGGKAGIGLRDLLGATWLYGFRRVWLHPSLSPMLRACLHGLDHFLPPLSAVQAPWLRTRTHLRIQVFVSEVRCILRSTGLAS